MAVAPRPPPAQLPGGRDGVRRGGGGAVSRLDTALSAVRTVLTLRLAPVLLLVFCVVWPIAGFPWWPLAFVLALGVVLRVLRFGYLLAGRRGPGSCSSRHRDDMRAGAAADPAAAVSGRPPTASAAGLVGVRARG